MPYLLTPPLLESTVRKLKCGDLVLITGTIFTARDAAHKFLLEKAAPESLPFNLKGAILYHCGPIVRKVGNEYQIVAAGPTTSIREEPYEAEVIKKYEVRALIGKGGMGEKTLQALKEFGAVYLAAVGGAAALLARCVKKVKNVYFLEEFGIPEAFWELQVENFPAIVTMDSNGNSLHEEVRQKSEEKFQELLGLSSILNLIRQARS